MILSEKIIETHLKDPSFKEEIIKKFDRREEFFDDREKMQELFSSLNEKNVYIIKGIFNCFHKERGNLYGILFLILNMDKKILEKIELVTSYESWRYNCKFNTDWEDFYTNILGCKLRRKKVDNRLNHSLIEYIRGAFEEDGETLFSHLLNNNLELFKEDLKEIIKIELDDWEIDLQIDVDKINSYFFKDIEFSPLEDLSEKNNIKKEDKENLEYIKLKISLVIAPISGVPINNLRVGEELIVKIIEDSKLGRYIGKLMGGYEEEKPIPIIARLKEIHPVGLGKVRVICEFGPGVFGETIVSKKVKVRTIFEKEKIKKNKIREILPKLLERDFSPNFIIITLILALTLSCISSLFLLFIK